MEEKKTTKSVRIPFIYDELMEKLNIKFTDFVNNSLKKELLFKYKDGLNKEIKQKEEELKSLREAREIMNPEPKTPEEKQYLKETKEYLKKFPQNSQGRINYYANVFGKFILSEKEFKELLKKV